MSKTKKETKQEKPEVKKVIKDAIVIFTKDKAFKVSYNVNDDTIKIEEV